MVLVLCWLPWLLCALVEVMALLASTSRCRVLVLWLPAAVRAALVRAWEWGWGPAAWVNIQQTMALLFLILLQVLLGVLWCCPGEALQLHTLIPQLLLLLVRRLWAGPCHPLLLLLLLMVQPHRCARLVLCCAGILDAEHSQLLLLLLLLLLLEEE
jgi:hypothetical protein